MTLTSISLLPLHFTRYKAESTIGKQYARQSDGSIKKAQRHLHRARADQLRAGSFASFMAYRHSLDGHHALSFGITQHKQATVVPRSVFDSLEPAADGGPYITRTSDSFSWPSGPGLLLVDFDAGAAPIPMTAAELVGALRDAVPELQAVTIGAAPSSSALAFQGDVDGAKRRGCHIFIPVDQARRIPEVGRTIFDRLALAGYGYIAVGEAGQMLRRTLADVSVWQPERVVYLRPEMVGGLVQRDDLSSEVFPAVGVQGEHMLCVDALVSLADEERQRLDETWAELEHQKEAEALPVRQRWAEARAKEVAARRGVELSPEQLAEDAARFACTPKTLVLEKDHPLLLQDRREVTVADLLADPRRFDGVRMADPLEPDYGGADRRIAVARLLRNEGADPAIYSHAHGGQWFSLRTVEDDFGGLDDVPATVEASNDPGVRRFFVQSAADYSAGPPPKWHIRGVIPQGELVVVYGASGSGKSFVVLDMVAAISAGVPWRSMPVNQGRVVYVVAEGCAGFRKRLDALQQHAGVNLASLGLGVIADAPDLLAGDEVALADAIMAVGGADLVVVDTLAQVMPGGDENSSTEMGKAIKACKVLHQRTGATVLVVHHSGKDENKGARGWSGLRGAADAELEVVRGRSIDGSRSIRVKKQKDADDAGEFRFHLETVEIGVEDDGLTAITSCVVRHFEPEPDIFPDIDAEKDSKAGGVWHQRIRAQLAKSDGLDRVTLLVAVVDQAPVPPGRDRRREAAARALNELIKCGVCVSANDGSVRLKA